MVEFLTGYWWVIVVAIAAAVVVGFFIYRFAKKPTQEQLKKVKEWLLFAVTQAEKELGSGTGKIKLRYVYDMFLSKFSFLASVISFETFSALVDSALDEFREILVENPSVQNYVCLEEKSDEEND